MENGGVGDVDSSSPVNGGTLGHGLQGDVVAEATPEGSNALQSSDKVDVYPTTVGKMSPSPTDEGLPTNSVPEVPPAGKMERGIGVLCEMRLCCFYSDHQTTQRHKKICSLGITFCSN